METENKNEKINLTIDELLEKQKSIEFALLQLDRALTKAFRVSEEIVDFLRDQNNKKGE